MSETNPVAVAEPAPGATAAPQQTAQPSAAPAQAPASGTSTPPVQPPEVESLRAEVARLKGFQGFYTQAKQSGAWALAEDLLKEAGGDVNKAKAMFGTMQEAVQVADQVDRWGGISTIREYADAGLFQAGGAAAPDATPAPAARASGAPEPVEGITREEAETIFRSLLRDQQSQLSFQNTLGETALRVLRETGFERPTERQQRLIRGSLERAAKDLADADGRPVVREDVENAAQMYLQDVFGPLRAPAKVAATAAQHDENLPQTPPTSNAGGPGAQQPARSLKDMSPAEINRAIQERLAKEFPNRAMPGEGGPAAELPSHWSFGA